MKIDYQQAINLIATKEYAAALVILNHILEQDSSFIAAYYQRGQVKEKLQDFTGAIADYTQVIYLQPTAKAYMSIALINFSQGDILATITNTQSAIELDKSYPIAYRLLAQVYQEQKQIKAAINAYKKATSCYLEKGNKKNALYCFEQIEKLNSVPQIVNPTPEFLKSAITKAESGNYHGALTDLNWLLNVDPYNPEALCHRGLIAAKLGDLQRAITDLAQAIKIEPHNQKWQYQRGMARLDLADAYGALQDFSQLLKREPTNVDFLLQRGRAYVQLKQYDEAIQDYNNALMLEPNKGEIYWGLGNLQIILENIEKAIANYQKAAMIFLNQGNYKQYQKAQAKIQAIEGDIRQRKTEAAKIIRIPIKYFTSHHGSAVIEVMFNQKYTFDLIVDTGATMTMLTEKMQRAMLLNTIGRTWCSVADGRYVELDVCHVNSLTVQKATVNHLDVLVAPRETRAEGLLGQDFLRNYEVRILREEIHLYPH